MNAKLTALLAAAKDGERYQYAKPILAGTDDKIADRRALAIASALARGLVGDSAIDAAMKEAK